MDKFSNRLKELRLKNGLTHQEIADKLKVNRGSYTNWENGKREPNLAKIVEIATILNSSVDYLIGKDDVNILNFSSEELKKMSPDQKETLVKKLAENMDVIFEAGMEKFKLTEKEMEKVKYIFLKELSKKIKVNK